MYTSTITVPMGMTYGAFTPYVVSPPVMADHSLAVAQLQAESKAHETKLDTNDNHTTMGLWARSPDAALHG